MYVYILVSNDFQDPCKKHLLISGECVGNWNQLPLSWWPNLKKEHVSNVINIGRHAALRLTVVCRYRLPTSKNWPPIASERSKFIRMASAIDERLNNYSLRHGPITVYPITQLRFCNFFAEFVHWIHRKQDLLSYIVLLELEELVNSHIICFKASKNINLNCIPHCQK